MKLFNPLLQSPPWIFVNYHNDSLPDNNGTLIAFNATEEEQEGDESEIVRVTGGRDDNLIKLLAAKLNFKFCSVIVPLVHFNSTETL